MKKICPVCQKEFEPIHGKQKYCCEKCKVEAHRVRSRENYYKEKPNPKGWHFCDRKDCLYYNDYKVNKKPENRCDYNWLTGELRECARGAECTRYKHATPTERRKYRNLKLKGNEDGDGRPLY